MELDLHPIRDLVALTMNQQVIWLNRREIEALPHKLMMALRAMDCSPPAVELPSPRSN